MVLKSIEARRAGELVDKRATPQAAATLYPVEFYYLTAARFFALAAVPEKEGY